MDYGRLKRGTIRVCVRLLMKGRTPKDYER
jgi:hypothetical protein